MALRPTLYRFHIQLSDVDRGIYEALDLRVAMHPSESPPFLLTRVLAYALNLQEGLKFTEGIATPDEPALQVSDLTGAMQMWIDIGNPSARRLHKATKTAKRVRIYTYRDPELLVREMAGQDVHRIETVEVYALDPKFLTSVAATLDRDNHWQLLLTEGELSLSVGEQTFATEISKQCLV